MKKVLVIGMSNILGGVEKVVLSIIGQLSERYEFEFLCFGNDYSYEHTYGNVKFHYVVRRKENYIKSQKQQKEFWKKNGKKYDFVWINTASASNISSHRYAKRYSNAKIITHSHNSKIEHSSNLFRYIHTILHYLNRPVIVKYSDELIACSKIAAEHLFGAESDRAKVIYNGIHVQEFLFSSELRNRQRESLCVSDEDILLLCIGRLVSVKNFLFAIKVFEVLKQESAIYKLLILGDGKERELLEKYVKDHAIDNVMFLGFKDIIKPFLDASDIILQPSLFEGFPVSTIETQANGLRCLISSNITREVAKTNLVSYIDIGDQSISKWVNEIKSFTFPADRTHYNKEIYDAGFDVTNAAELFERILS